MSGHPGPGPRGLRTLGGISGPSPHRGASCLCGKERTGIQIPSKAQTYCVSLVLVLQVGDSSSCPAAREGLHSQEMHLCAICFQRGRLAPPSPSTTGSNEALPEGPSSESPPWDKRGPRQGGWRQAAKGQQTDRRGAVVPIMRQEVNQPLGLPVGLPTRGPATTQALSLLPDTEPWCLDSLPLQVTGPGATAWTEAVRGGPGLGPSPCHQF